MVKRVSYLFIGLFVIIVYVCDIEDFYKIWMDVVCVFEDVVCCENIFWNKEFVIDEVIFLFDYMSYRMFKVLVWLCVFDEVVWSVVLFLFSGIIDYVNIVVV